MEKPTRYYLVGGHLEQDPNGNLCYWQAYNELCADYLALREEADQLNSDLHYYKADTERQTGLKLKLETENHSLTDKIAAQRQRMQDEYYGLLDRMAGYRKADADEIKRLKEENQGLRAQLNVESSSIHEDLFGHHG